MDSNRMEARAVMNGTPRQPEFASISENLCSPPSELYQPLNTANEEIRLLRVTNLQLRPPNCVPARTKGIRLECTLLAVSLREMPKYDALSYTWGDPDQLYTVRINGHRMRIRVNLFNALCMLSHTSSVASYLWADAICINQDDFFERSSQVSMMAQIFKQAHTVRVWLGKRFSPAKSFFVKAESKAEVSELLDPNDDSLEGLQHIVSQAWWSRLWVIQEVLLASKAVVHCGADVVPFETLLQAISDILKAMAYNRVSPEEVAALGWNHADHVQQIYFTFDQRHFNQTFQSDVCRTILRFQRFRKSNVLDGRDRVYGVLGLLPDDIGVKPDYTLSKADVYRDCALQVMRWSKSLHMLLLCNPSSDKLSESPSWVPSHEGVQTGLYPAYVTDMGCSGMASFELRIIGRSRLVVRGHHLQHVRLNGYLHQLGMPVEIEGKFSKDADQIHWDLGAIIDDDGAFAVTNHQEKLVNNVPFFNESTIHECREQLEVWYDQVTQDTDQPEELLKRSAEFWHHLTRGVPTNVVGMGAMKLAYETRELTQSLNSWLKDGKALAGESEKFLYDVLGKSWGDVLFLDDDGKMVICHFVPDAGDFVSILATCPLPLILQPIGQAEEAENEVFRILEFCHYEGKSRGEHVREATIRAMDFKHTVSRDPDIQLFVDAIRNLYTVPDTIVHAPSQDCLDIAIELLLYHDPEHHRCKHPIWSPSFAKEGVLESSGRNFKDMCGIPDIGSGGAKRQVTVCFTSTPRLFRELLVTAVCFFVRSVTILSGEWRAMRDNHGNKNAATTTPHGLEAILLCSGLLIFEAVVNIRRAQYAMGDVELSGRLSNIEAMLREVFEDESADILVVSFYQSLVNLAEDEITIEQNHDWVFQEIILA